VKRWTFAEGLGQIASARHVDDYEYQTSSQVLKESNLYHRKHWEWVYIYASAKRFGLLKPGKSALGFGVGREPLVSAFAAAGVQVLATDQPSETAGAWARTGQHSAKLKELHRPDVCGEEEFNRLVAFQAIDMTDLPTDLNRVDLAWSSCCFEHLGSPEAGYEFLRNSMELVAPGGVGLHTTEFDLSRFRPLLQTGSVTAGDYVVFYRRHEIARIVRRLRAAGYQADIDWRVSKSHPMELQIDRVPYTHDPHMRVEVGNRVVTSIGLCIRKPPE